MVATGSHSVRIGGPSRLGAAGGVAFYRSIAFFGSHWGFERAYRMRVSDDFDGKSTRFSEGTFHAIDQRAFLFVASRFGAAHV